MAERAQEQAGFLVRGSCDIARPFADPAALTQYLTNGKFSKLRHRLAADAKSLYALHECGRLHGTVRLRWGFLDERIPAPWVHGDEPTLYHLKERVHASGLPLDVVVGTAPGWSDPWSRVQPATVVRDLSGWGWWLVDGMGFPIDDRDVQAARLGGEGGEEA